MKRFLSLLAAAVLLVGLYSCHSAEKVIYFQDIENGESVPVRGVEYLTLQAGDKVSIIVSSSATPELAQKYNLAVAQNRVGVSSNVGYSNVGVYTIDDNGEVSIPSVGRVRIAGLTRSEAADRIEGIFHNGIINDAVVTISAYDRYITILGEVGRPGRISLDRDNITLLEALGQAGDLTIHGQRDRVLVQRQEGNELKNYYVDLRSKNIFNSPVYNLRQNDIIYVAPDEVRVTDASFNDGSLRRISTWMSITSFLLSLGILIFR